MLVRGCLIPKDARRIDFRAHYNIDYLDADGSGIRGEIILIDVAIKLKAIR